MENARKNREKGWKNADFFEGVWKSPLKQRVVSGSNGKLAAMISR
jgi:hypothetical protein